MPLCLQHRLCAGDGAIGTLAWDFASRLIKNRLPRLVLVAAVMIGGTGISPLIHLVVDDKPANPPEWNANDHMWASARFIGSYDARIADYGTALGRSVFPPLTPETRPTPDFEARDLPMENFGYQYFLGDYHPPLGSFFAAVLAAGLAGLAGSRTRRLPASASGASLLPATLPLMLITNTWIFPFALVLQAAWVGWRYLQKTTTGLGRAIGRWPDQRLAGLPLPQRPGQPGHQHAHPPGQMDGSHALAALCGTDVATAAVAATGFV